ncbi:MAG: hypothetical protein E7673_04585 [Ruminococcaceae bacterium]|nr:hypothetical protein [Oscillospiraceae bacterium]
MKKLTKISLLILAFALLCAGIVMSVSGAEENSGLVSYVDAEGNKQEGTLAVAWENAADATEITLLGNCVMEEKLILSGKNLTVNIGSYTLTSTDISAFELKGNTSLTIKGEGRILLDGMLATSNADGVTFSIEGTHGTKGIDIIHTGYANNRLVYTEFGAWSFKNIDVYSDAVGKQWHSFFEMRNVTSVDVDFVFDTVRFEYDTPYMSHPGQFVVNVAGTGHLLIKNSAFFTEHSGIKSGVAVNPNEEVIRIENSLISCSTNRSSIINQSEGNFSARNYVILGMNDSFKGSPKQIINIYDSFLECNYRGICFENESGEMSENVANIYNTTIRNLSLNGNDTSENISRAIMLRFFGDSAVISRKTALAGATGGKQPFSVAEAGFRTNVHGIMTSLKDGEGIKVIENVIETKDETTGEIIKTENEYVFACESKKYAWVYEPVGNPDAPYLLVERTFAEDGTETTFDKYATDYKFAGFETYQFNNIAKTSYDEYLIYKDGSKTSGWTAYEPFGDTQGTGNSGSTAEAKMKSFQWAQRGGSYFIAGDAQNKYMRYWVGESETGTVQLSGSESPYWIMGERQASSADQYECIRTNVFGEKRKAVAVVDVDFGTDNGIFPNFTLQFTSRYSGVKTGGSQSYDINVSPSVWLEVTEGGKVVNKLGTEGTNLTEVPEVEFNGANMWNHMSVVFYTDPMYEGGLAYVYLNGELIGTNAFYTGNNETTYFQGLRFNIPKAQISNGTLCIDNVSLRCYENYMIDGEADGFDKSPENYIIKNSPGTYIGTAFAAAGNTYRGSSLEEIQAKANELGTVVRLQKDFYGPVKTNATVLSNGYEMNPTADSYAANIVYDENTGNTIYQFNELYNDLKVNYYWYVGEYGNLEQMKDEAYYVKTEVAPGQIPTYTGDSIPSVKDLVNYVKKVHCGWHSAGDDRIVDELKPVTLSMAISQAGAPIYMYPSYIYENPIAYTKNANGMVDIACSEYEASELLVSLNPGETFVLCRDIQFADEFLDKRLEADGEIYGGKYDYDGDGVLEPVRTSDSTKKEVFDYSEAELTAMREASAKMALDLNGYTIKVGHATKRGTLLAVGENVTLSVYSSQPGGMIESVQGVAGSNTMYGYRILEVFGGTNTGAGSFNNSNAHLVVGTVEVDGKVIPGSNLTLYGCLLIEGRSGDDTCSIEVDGIRAIRHNNSTDAGSKYAFATSYYSGSMTVTNTTIIAPTSTSVINLKDYDNTAFKMTPEVRFENCVILNKGNANILDHTGDDENGICLTLKNIITNGTIETAVNRGKVLIDSGVMAQAILKNGLNVASYAEGVSQAKYNQPMNLNGVSDTGIIDVYVPSKSNATINPTARRFFFVEAGKESLVPEEANVIVLPVLPVATATASDIVNVTFMGLDGKGTTESFVKGGLPTAPATSDYKISEFTTLVFKGDYDKKITSVDTDVTFYPNYDVVNKISGLKSSVSFYTSFNVNVYVPYEYKAYFVGASVGATALEIKDVTVDGVQYIMCSMPVTPDMFAENVEFVLEFTEEYDGVSYNGTAEITTSVMSYAVTILSDSASVYTNADKTLVYAALVYANEVITYTVKEANEEVEALVEEYKAFATADSEDKYSEAFDETNLSAAFLKATVRLDSAPTIVFTTLRNFVGTLTFTIGNKTVEYTVNGNSDRTVVLEGLTIAEFTSDILITAEGSIGDTPVVITDGKYNVATFAQYHIENSAYGEGEIPTDAQLSSKKAVSVIDAMYQYAAAAKAYVAK